MTPEQQIKIVVADDDPGDVELLSRRIQQLAEWQPVLTHVREPAALRELLTRVEADVVFIDVNLGPDSGIEVLKRLREAGELTPIVMLTGQGGESIVKECLLSGADDYLNKNALDVSTLRRTLLHARAQFRQRHTEAKLHLIQYTVDHAPDPVLWVCEDGRFTYANLSACQMLECTPHDMPSLSAADVLFGGAGERWREAWDEIKRRGVITCEEMFSGPGGSGVPVELRLHYIRWQKVDRACIVVRDLSERKQAEAALHEKEEQLRHKQRLEAVGSLAGGIAHEFNNLLHSIRGYAKFAMEGLAEEDSRHQDLEQVIVAADQAAVLTRQLLGFSRRQPLEPGVFAVNEAVTDLLKMVRPLIGEHIELDTSLAPDAGELCADRNLLQQVLLNLCINARDAMPEGGRLLLATERADRIEADTVLAAGGGANDYVKISVRDTGCGMPAEVRSRIFEPFFTTKGIGKGTGLGLAMVYGSVQQHGGAIAVDSQLGEGTCFNIYLPRNRSIAAAPAEPNEMVIAGGGETILVAEDDPMVRNLALR
ncbi:MAG TPA: ATP-binding protein, partial [Pirellulales bacterium]|nr:ATP-binding protein [Pirellulales bacterium]